MISSQLIKYEYKDNLCELRIFVPTNDSARKSNDDDGGITRRWLKNIRNFDVYIENNYFLIFLDVRLYKFYSSRHFNVKAIEKLVLAYKAKEQLLKVTIPCLPLRKDTTEESIENVLNRESSLVADEISVNISKLKRITDCCFVQDDNGCLTKPIADFRFGFGSKFHGKLKQLKFNSNDPNLMNPQHCSPLKRSINRYIDEAKAFSPEQYKLNFVELQVPDGHNNPMKFLINYKDIKLTAEEEQLLHNLTSRTLLMNTVTDEDQMEIECGLISILMAICYDVRCTSNEPTCESGWTRSILSSLFNYFEPFNSIREVVISFCRRSLTYPYYRNYELSRQCMEDCVKILQRHPQWIIKQLLVTYKLFENSDRDIFNYYYLKDYIFYASKCVPATHLKMLARNLKNILFDIYKRHLGLSLMQIEKDLIKEIITDVDSESSNSGSDGSDDDDDEDDDDEDDDDDDDDEDEDNNDEDDDDYNDNYSDANDNDDDDDEDDDANNDNDADNNAESDENINGTCNNNPKSDDHCNDAENGNESCESELCNTNEDSSDDTEENSVIEKQMQNMKI